MGHRLVAQIAYDHMTERTKQVFNQYNQAMDKVYKPQSFINAAVWLDTLRYQDIHWFDTMHYIDIPFSNDGHALPPAEEINAIWGIEKSLLILSNKYAKNFDKGIALRVLLHIVGDIHQPLHAATRVNISFPTGDRGGNLLLINAHPIARNLHAYWDRGAGFLMSKRRYTPLQIEKKALRIEKNFPCDLLKKEDNNPRNWINESHDLAVNIVYKALPKTNIPDKAYHQLTKKIVEKQIALAGCRLAALLNQYDKIN